MENMKEFYTEEEKDTILEQYINFRIMKTEGEQGMKKIRPIVEEIIGTAEEYSTENHKAYYTMSERKHFDEEGLKAKYPEIWKEFSGKKVIVSLNVK